MRSSSFGRLGFDIRAWSLALPLAFAPQLAVAAQPDGCPTWFPDFQCERHGRYEGFTAPVTQPYLFEDPFITTGANLVGIWHQFPKSSIFGGGHVNIAALQLRVAVTDRLAFIATQDGIAFLDADLDILRRQTDLMDMTVGFKYALIDRPETGVIVTPSLRFRIPSGSRDVFQGNGDGVFIPGLSFGWGSEEGVHFLGNVGSELPVDGGATSTSIFWNMHVDYNIMNYVSPFVELHGYHYVDNGDGKNRINTGIGTVTVDQATNLLGLDPFEGLDYSNLGSRDVRGHDVFIAAFGARVPIGKHLSVGAAYEIPISDGEDVIKQRVTTSLTLEF